LRSLALLLAIVPVVGSVGQASASSSTPARIETARILVRFDEHASAAAQNSALAGIDARRLGTIDQLGISVVAVSARAAKAAVRRVGASPRVSYVVRGGIARGNRVKRVKTGDPYLNSTSWQLESLGLPKAWSLSTGSAKIIVAVLDSGVDRRHEDLGAFVPGRDFVGGGATSDNNGHGTAVSGTIAAQGGNGKGIAGVCWMCKVMPVKVLGPDNAGSWSDVAAGVIWATKHGARVINMSLGLPKGSRSIAAAVRYAVRHDVVVVASSGNENSTKPDYPAAYPGVLSVGAVDETGTRYSNSNHNVRYGKWGSNYGSWVDVDAPGCVNSTSPGGNYTYFCGTSASAPFVAGLAGLALSYAPRASAARVVSAIETTARQTKDKNSAHGLIDAAATLEKLARARTH
ncbi:MAG: S8 family serine peptidase, partial [Gaiellaceae bacterium]